MRHAPGRLLCCAQVRRYAGSGGVRPGRSSAPAPPARLRPAVTGRCAARLPASPGRNFLLLPPPASGAGAFLRPPCLCATLAPPWLASVGERTGARARRPPRAHTCPPPAPPHPLTLAQAHAGVDGAPAHVMVFLRPGVRARLCGRRGTSTSQLAAGVAAGWPGFGLPGWTGRKKRDSPARAFRPSAIARARPFVAFAPSGSIALRRDLRPGGRPAARARREGRFRFARGRASARERAGARAINCPRANPRAGRPRPAARANYRRADAASTPPQTQPKIARERVAIGPLDTAIITRTSSLDSIITAPPRARARAARPGPNPNPAPTKTSFIRTHHASCIDPDNDSP